MFPFLLLFRSVLLCFLQLYVYFDTVSFDYFEVVKALDTFLMADAILKNTTSPETRFLKIISLLLFRSDAGSPIESVRGNDALVRAAITVVGEDPPLVQASHASFLFGKGDFEYFTFVPNDLGFPRLQNRHLV